jgi:hypothetical protein
MGCPGGAATGGARCAGSARRRLAAVLPAARCPAGASGRTWSGTPAAPRSPPRWSAADRFLQSRPVRLPRQPGPGRQRCVSAGGACPCGPHDPRSAPARLSSPPPARAAGGGLPGPAGPGPGLAGQEEPRVPAAGRGPGPRAAAGGMRRAAAVPGVPDGGLRRGPAASFARGRITGRRAGLAGLPPGTGSMHARLGAGRQVRRPAVPPGTSPMPGIPGRLLGAYAARPAVPAGLDTRPGAERRWPAAAIGRRAAGPGTVAGPGWVAVTAGDAACPLVRREEADHDDCAG